MRVLVTGAAGFIGYHLSHTLLRRGLDVLGIDDCNPYYDVRLKHARLDLLRREKRFVFEQLDFSDHAALFRLGDGVEAVVHLGAQAGVRYSMEQPFAYAAANLTGHLSVLELVRHSPGIRHLIYASSSSVYGTGTAMPYSERARADRPSSLYGATKRADELMSHSYTHLFGLRQTGLRFFTVYGPWGRPDMAYFGFAEAIMAGKPVTLYGQGRLKRDFTYIDDVMAGILGVFDHPPEAAEHRVFNIGNNRPEYVTELVRLLEISLGREALVKEVPKPQADPEETWADISALAALCGYTPQTPLAVGIPKFAEWYLNWRKQRGE